MDHPVGVPRADSVGTRRAGGGSGGDSRRHRVPQISVRGRHAADGGRRGRGIAEPHVASRAVGDRRRRPAADRRRRQRAAPDHGARVVVATAAAGRWQRRDGRDEGAARGESAARCARGVRAGTGRHRVERAADAALARPRARRCFAGGVRQGGRGDGRGRNDPVHGDAG